MMHPTHKARFSDSSLYDEVCVHCNLTDMAPGWSLPCKKAPVTEPPAKPPLDLSKPPFMTLDRTPMHFVGFGGGGETIWQYPDGEVVRRSANGWVDMCEVYKSRGDIINAPPPKVKETVWANIYPSGNGMFRGYIYSTLEAAKSRADFDAIDTVPVEIEYTPKEPLK